METCSVTKLVDETHDRPLIHQELHRGEALVGCVGVVGGRGPGAKAVVHPNLRAVDVVDGVDRPVDIEVIAPLRRPTAGEGDGDRVDRREDDLEMLALHPAGVASWAARTGPAAATVMPTPAALAAAPARNAVRRLMGAFVLVGRSCDTVVLLGETRIATKWL